ncbi:MAG TPA: TIM44-like domain-containing protein [Thermoleophilaceae bacterium]
MRRIPLALFILLSLPAQAFARAGGGSSGYGGGGGGGGGGSSYHGTGGTGSGGVSWPVLVGIVFLILVFVAWGSFVSWRAVRRRKERVARTITASAEAAADDGWFAADRVQQDAATLFRDIQAAWDGRDRGRLGRLVGDDLMVEWKRRLDHFDAIKWHNRVEVREGPAVEYVGIVNREDDDEDRVCVRLTGKLFDVVETEGGKRIQRKGETSDVTAFSEFWTLARREGHWIVVSIEQEAEGQHNLQEPLVPTPWSDDQKLHDEAVVEHAQAGAASENVASLFSVEFADDARKAALDLSLVDDRYSPDVLEVATRRALAAWAEAVDGDDAALEALAEPDAVHELLYGDDSSGRTRLVVRGPQLEEVRILELDSNATPPSFTVEARVRGRRYREDRDTVAVVSGDPDTETTFTQSWRLVLSDVNETPWRIGVTHAGSRVAP